MRRPKPEQSIDEIVAATRRRSLREARAVQHKVSQAREETSRLLTEFRKLDPELDKVVLFGSLATGRIRSQGFDIDLAVRSTKYFRLVACALRSRFPVDVVDLDGVPSHIRASIERDGKVLYEKHEE